MLPVIQIKNKRYKKFVRSRNLDDLKTFKNFRNQLTKEIRSARERYHNASFRASAGHSDMLWEKMNTALNRRSVFQPISKVVKDGVELSQVSLANAFNDFFLNIVPRSCINDDILEYMPFTNTNSIFFYPIDDSGVIRIFMELKNSSSCDVDGI